jgi:hypothetical protein
MNSETSIESTSVLPAKTTVRPAWRRVDVEPAGEEVEDPARGDHRDRAEGKRDRRRDRRAEDEQQDDQQERQRQQLTALGGLDRLVLDRPREAREPGLGRRHRSVDLRFERFVEERHGLVHRSPRVDVEVGQDQRPVRPRPQAFDAATVPGGERRHRRVFAQRPHQPRPLAVERGARPFEQDRERRRVAEMLTQHLVGARGRRPGNLERGRVEPLLDPDPDHAERDQHKCRDGENRAWMPQQQRVPLGWGRTGGPWPYPAPPASHAW